MTREEDKAAMEDAEEMPPEGGEAAPKVPEGERADAWGKDWPPYGDRVNQRPPGRRWLLRGREEKGPDGVSRAENGLFPLGKVGMFAAAGGVGKTMAAIDLAVAVVTGGAWFGAYPVAAAGRVLLLLGEEDADEIHRRVWGATHREDGGDTLTEKQREALAADLFAVPLAGNPDVALTQVDDGSGVLTDAARALLERLERMGEEKPWSLIVVDPVSRFAGMDTEKDNAAATRFIQVLEKLVKVPGTPSVLLLHHTSQGARLSKSTDATGARGVTGISDAVRWQSTLVGDVEGFATFAVNKSNYGPPSPPLKLVRGHGGRLYLAGVEDKVRYEAALFAAMVEAEKRDLLKKKAKDAAKVAAEEKEAEEEDGAAPETTPRKGGGPAGPEAAR